MSELRFAKQSSSFPSRIVCLSDEGVNSCIYSESKIESPECQVFPRALLR